MSKAENLIKTGDTVWFKAYDEHEPIKSTVGRIGTLHELNRTFLNSNDSRVFYELHNDASDSPYPFTVTTARWIE